MLRDPQKRQVYDRYGHEGLAASGRGGMAGGRRSRRPVRQMFGDFLGGGARAAAGARPAARRGHRGRARRRSRWRPRPASRRPSRCATRRTARPAAATARSRGRSRAPCRRCKGSGREYVQAGGLFSFPQACRGCGGRGTVIPDPCPTCRGAGRVETRESIEIDIPPGVDTRMRLSVPGHGHEGTPGAAREPGTGHPRPRAQGLRARRAQPDLPAADLVRPRGPGRADRDHHADRARR